MRNDENFMKSIKTTHIYHLDAWLCLKLMCNRKTLLWLHTNKQFSLWVKQCHFNVFPLTNMQKGVRVLYSLNGPTMSILNFYLVPIQMRFRIQITCAIGTIPTPSITITTWTITIIPITTTTKSTIGTIEIPWVLEQVIYYYNFPAVFFCFQSVLFFIDFVDLLARFSLRFSYVPKPLEKGVLPTDRIFSFKLLQASSMHFFSNISRT